MIDYIRKLLNKYLLVDFFNRMSTSPLQYKILMTVFLIILVVLVTLLINLVIPVNNTILISSIVAWLKSLIIIVVFFCDNKLNGLNKTVY
jgi:hypothetical protein